MRSYHSSWKLAPGERCNIPRYLGGKADEFKQVLNDNPREYKFDCDLETAKEYARLLAEDTSKFHKFVQVSETQGLLQYQASLSAVIILLYYSKKH